QEIKEYYEKIVTKENAVNEIKTLSNRNLNIKREVESIQNKGYAFEDTYQVLEGSKMFYYSNEDKSINGFIEVNSDNYLVYEFSYDSKGQIESGVLRDSNKSVEYDKDNGITKKSNSETKVSSNKLRVSATASSQYSKPDKRTVSFICGLLMTYSGWSLNQIAALVLKGLGAGPVGLGAVALLFTLGTTYASTYC
ncbi:hypothetical protein ABGF38_04300, partial [Helcococcus ovis]